MKVTINVRRHPEQMRRSCTRDEENGKKIKAISYQLSAVSYKLLAVSWKLKALNDSGRQGVILSGSEGSIPVMRKTVRRHQHNRFFTPYHHPVSRFSHKAFLPPF